MLKRILIIENDVIASALAKMRLIDGDFDVITAEDTINGLVKIRLNKPDLVLLASSVAGKDGFEILKDVKEDAFISHVPVVMLLDSASKEDVQKSLKLGASDWVEKSALASKEMLEKIENILK